MKVLLTGATGFVGRACVEWFLARGHSVRILKRATSRTLTGTSETILEMSEAVAQAHRLREALAAEVPDLVVHLAWSWATNTHRNDPRHFSENLRYTQLLVDLLADEFTNTHFIGIGSQAEYGVQNALLTPELPCLPTVGYGRAKWLAGHYARFRLPERAAWLRLLTAYGPGDDPNKFLPYVVKCFENGDQAVTSPGQQVWDWLYVTDAAEAIGRAGEERVAGIHVLASHETRSFRDMATSLQTIAKTKGLPAKDPQFGGRPYALSELFYLAGDSSSLRRLTGWAPRVSIDQGLPTLFTRRN